ncbi:DotU family type IV/VI secretion system protein [Fluviispira multicolorata]|uniref:Type IV / VI secretion system DotU domain-containing protein n=1 Tax=Fluviispira multicolorata TaxID=2654512 RepID=A0A833N5Z9_9BACT|nr:DotU family type IV/VI secretion system protein [Fluviispira multicolorata]KAB8031914.1 hypothetical protein GCL57_04520 [Fluviispira multicolorata]
MTLLQNYECPILFTQECILEIQNIINAIDLSMEKLNDSENSKEINSYTFEEAEIIKISTSLCECIGRKIDTLKKHKNYDSEVINLLHFALIALADEKLITKNWPGRVYWQNESLEKKVFQSRSAGDIFFDNCKKILTNRDYKFRNLSYCYYLCLCARFKGKYHSSDNQSEINRIKNSLYNFYGENNIEIKYDFDGVIPQSSLLIKTNSEENQKQRKFSHSLLLINFILVSIFLISSFYIWFNNTSMISKGINFLTNF